MNNHDKIYIEEYSGMVSSSITRKLQLEGYKHLITQNSEQFNLRNQQKVDIFFASEQLEFVFLAATGTPRRMDVQRIHKLGWKYKISFEEGMDNTIAILEEELMKIK